MKTNLISRIAQSFPVNPRPAEPLTEGLRDEDLQCTQPFIGLSWPEVPALLFGEYYDAFVFFTDDAYFYYLPGLMTQSLDHFQECRLALDVVFRHIDTDRILLSDNLPSLVSSHAYFWRTMADAQVACVTDWLDLLLATDPQKFRDEEILNALCGIEMMRAQR